jgi:hypothetical protein
MKNENEYLEKINIKDLKELIKLQNEIQLKYKYERINFINNFLSSNINLNDVDPIFHYLNLNSNIYYTNEQNKLFILLFIENFNLEYQKWLNNVEFKNLITISPRILFNNNNNNIEINNYNNNNNNIEINNYNNEILNKNNNVDENKNLKIKEWINYLKINDKMNDEKNIFKNLFPEKKFEGDFNILQMIYFYLQIERSKNPRYTRNNSIININNSNNFLTFQFWKGIWELPESLSNFLFLR